MLNKLHQILIVPIVNLLYTIIGLLRTITIIQSLTLVVLVLILIAIIAL